MSPSAGVPDDPSELRPTEALDRFIRKRQTDSSDRTLRSYRSRLNQFVEWCQDNEIELVGQLDSWHLDEYDLARRESGQAPATIKGHLSTLRVFIGYLETIGAVEDDLAESVDVPNLSADEEQSEERLAEEDAMAALSYFRDSRSYFGVPMHAFLEVAWHSGARMGSIRALDLGDYHSDEQYLVFDHRPSTETPLKNDVDGERFVGLNEQVCEALDYYIDRERSDKRDEHGRQPLFSTRQGRPSFTTLRAWSYLATEPCLWRDCPHGRRRESCEWTERQHASKCPSSRSPHRVRTGSITWQLNQGLDIEIVAERVNASPSVIRRFYDQATEAEEFEKRRRAAETALDIDNSDK
jgi:site-specific recombinase XerD